MTLLESKLGYTFTQPEMLLHALTHKSFANENKELGERDNERLEFLGDAVLDLALSEILMKKLPNENEGGLSKMRASLVNETFLSQLAIELGIAEILRLGKGESNTNGREKPRILASTFEAVIGAIFEESGYLAAREVVERLFDPYATPSETVTFERDFKTRLQELCQKSYGKPPNYELIEAKGPEHEKEFHIRVSIESRILGEGWGKTKKLAEQQAAQKAIEVLQ